MDNRQDATPPAVAVGGGATRPGGEAGADGDLPPELPLTPQSNNKAPSLAGCAGGAVPDSVPQLDVDVDGTGDGPKPPLNKDYLRNVSALSVSTGNSSLDGVVPPQNSSFDEEDGDEDNEEGEAPDTPKSSLVSSHRKHMTPVAKAVDRTPQQQLAPRLGADPRAKSPPMLVVNGAGSTASSVSGSGGGGALSPNGPSAAPPPPPHSHHRSSGRPSSAQAHRGRGALRPAHGVPARSPRPPRHVRAVDWCPPPSSSSVSSLGASGRVPPTVERSDRTTATSRAVRTGDDATVTTFATMTTMGDAGSILEADTEDEAGSSSGDEGDSDGEAGGGGVGEEEEEEVSMEDAREENGVVDRIPSRHSKKGLRGSLSGTTNQAFRASDDQSMVTFATTMSVGYAERGGGSGNKMVDKVPSLQPRAADVSIVTNDTVQMGDNQSLATWATSNTMGGQLTGNVVDHVPHQGEGEREGGEEEGGRGEDDDVSSGNATVGTSNAVKDEPSVTTFAASAPSDDRGISEVVDRIPTYAGGGTGRSVASGVTSGAVRASSAGVATGADDRSVASLATMTTMGDLGSIFETEPLADDAASGGAIALGVIGRAVVDVIPEATSSVASGTTDHSVRTDDGASVTTFGTVTTAGGGDAACNTGAADAGRGDGAAVDRVPARTAPSVATDATDRAVRTGDDQSVATWATSATSGVVGHVDEHVVDKTPEFGGGDASAASGATGRAVKDQEDQSVVTWCTVTTAGLGRRARSPPPASLAAPYAVDRVPSFPGARPPSQSLSGGTNQAVRASDDQSVVTFATMTTVGGMERDGSHVVDKVPSSALFRADTSIVTGDAVRTGDNQSLATWATANTMGGQITGDVVDHVPSPDEESNATAGTGGAVKEEQTVATFATSATLGDGGGISEVVDRIPTFAGGGRGAGTTVASGVTSAAVRARGDDRSVTSFATMTTVGGVSTYEADDPSGRFAANHADGGKMVDRIPSSAGRGGVAESVSSRTDAAVRSGDDPTVTTFAASTDAGGGSGEGSSAVVGMGHRASACSDQSAEDVLSASGASSASARVSAPTTGILREGRHGRPYRVPPEQGRVQSDSSAAAAMAASSVATTGMATMAGTMTAAVPGGLPFDAGESVSNAHILRAMSDLRFHVDYRMGELRELNRRDSERVVQIIQQEQAKRTALETRLHSQLLLQSESMVAMELKLLRLEAKVAQRDSRRQQQQQQRRQPPGIHSGTPATITDRLPPIAATPSTPNRSDEEDDSFEELELTPRGANRHHHGISSGAYAHSGSQRGVGPANIAVVTRSGASVASAVTATSFQEGDFSHALNDDGGSDDGDIEDEGDDNDDDGSASTPTHSSRNRISNLESILLNPINQAGSSSGGNNDQGISTRAVRGPPDADGTSSLPTSVTSATVASTVVTATTRGNESTLGITRIPSRASEEDVLRVERTATEEEPGAPRASRDSMRSNNSEDYDLPGRPPRSRSQSPLTVQSDAAGSRSVAESASLGPSVLSTAAVAPARSFGTRRANAAIADQVGRSMANRVVSFNPNDLAAGSEDVARSGAGAGTLPHHHHHPSGMQEGDEGGMGDSITMPDELDNFSDIADAFSNSARVWREEYEARLDAIHKRLGG